MKEKPEIFICSCGSFEHQLIFWYDEDENDIHVYHHIITYRNFFKRLWVGLKYAFGYKSRYGEFDSFIFQPEDLDRLNTFLQKIKK